MINLRPYQTKATENLQEYFFQIAEAQQIQRIQSRRARMVFKAPTGAGKTVIMASFLQQLVRDLPLHLNLPNRRYAFIWLAPNQLHEQSLLSLRSFFEETRTLQCKYFSDLSDRSIQEGDILFLNWESIWSKKNNIVKDGESAWNLYDIIHTTKEKGIEVVVIVDEAHRNLMGPQCQNVLLQIDAAMEIEVSATPDYQAQYNVEIPRIQVIQSGMIKKSIILNPRLNGQIGVSLNELLIQESVKKRASLERIYAKQKSPVRPLLLIQLPNDKKEEENQLDRTIHEQVVASLGAKGITTQNGKLAIWLSKEKVNQSDQSIKPFDSTVEVLLFKQAIALGWDCPRAAVLLIFRELGDNSFAIQTVGRILRMPEQKHYADDTLNHGYVYTDLSRDVIQIQDDAKGFISMDVAKRSDLYEELDIPKEHLKMWGSRNVLGLRIRGALKQAALNDGWVDPVNKANAVALNLTHLQNNLVHVNPAGISIQIPKDTVLDQMVFDGGVVQVNNRTGIAKTTNELMQLFDQYCAQSCMPYEVHRSTGKLKMALVELMQDFLATTEYDTYKLVLYPENKFYWNRLIDEAKTIFEGWVVQAAQRQRLLEVVPWEVPESRAYFGDMYTQGSAPRHVLQEYFQQNGASEPECRFVEFLEKFGECLRWWYKNGDSGMEHFSVSYIATTGEPRLFYPDFIVLFGDGTMGFFDTKAKNSDAESSAKHKALRAYLAKLGAQTGKAYVGGIVIEDPQGSQVWKMSRFDIQDSHDLTGWDALKLVDYKGDWVYKEKEPTQAIHASKVQNTAESMFHVPMKKTLK